MGKVNQHFPQGT